MNIQKAFQMLKPITLIIPKKLPKPKLFHPQPAHLYFLLSLSSLSNPSQISSRSSGFCEKSSSPAESKADSILPRSSDAASGAQSNLDFGRSVNEVFPPETPGGRNEVPFKEKRSCRCVCLFFFVFPFILPVKSTW